MRVTFCPINVRSILARIAGGQDVAIRKENPVIERAASWNFVVTSFASSDSSCLLALCLAPDTRGDELSR